MTRLNMGVPGLDAEVRGQFLVNHHSEILGSGREEVRRAGGRAFRAHAGGRALGRRRWAGGECLDAAALDAGSRAVESATEAAEAPATARAQRTFRRAGADGWELSSLAGGARTGGLLDRHGRPCDQHDLGAIGGTRDHPGGGRCAARVDRAVRLYVGLEELVQAAGQFAGAFTKEETDHAVWAHVREAGDCGDRGEFAGSQGTNERMHATHQDRLVKKLRRKQKERARRNRTKNTKRGHF